LSSIQANRILAATIEDESRKFKGYGCSLVVPFMGTKWNRDEPGTKAHVQIPSCAGTVVPRALFERIGGYDSGMVLYGGAEPEFGVRAWLAGFQVVALPQLRVCHRFKNDSERDRHIEEHRTCMVHNCLRFGLLYLSDLASLQMLRHFAMIFPEHMVEATRMIEESDVWQRREFLSNRLEHDFRWFINHFNLKDQIGSEIL
jgi:GT2 family glycosyltransferase